MGQEIRHHTIVANGLRQHYMEAGSGAPVFLLHGFPETAYAWRKQIPALAEHYRVIVPDLRGYGETDKPAAGYDKRTMAADIHALAESLGIGRAAVIGHDRGARVATRLAKDHPEFVERLGVLDNIPTRVIFNEMDAKMAKGHWFFIFNQVPDLPEALIAGREEIWLRHFFTHWCHDPTVITAEDLRVYTASYAAPGAVRGAMNDYRAGQEDVAQDEEDADVKIDCPILALWGADFELVGKMFDVEAIWKEMGSNVTALAIPQCCHLPHEECPTEVNAALLEFLRGWKEA